MNEVTLRKTAEMALELLVAYQDYTGDFRIANKCSETIQALRQALAQPEQDHGFDRTASHMAGEYVDTAEQEPAVTEKDGSPCPEFWDWLPKAYNFEGLGEFTKYNMEVAFLAGKNTVLAQPEPWDTSDTAHRPCGLSVEQSIAQSEQAEKQAALDGLAETSREIEQEPVAYVYDGDLHWHDHVLTTYAAAMEGEDLYTAPVSKPWVSLTDEEIKAIEFESNPDTFKYLPTVQFARAIEAALWEKNNG